MELEVAYVLSDLSLILWVYSFFVDPMDDLNSSSVTVLALLQTKVKVVFDSIASSAATSMSRRLKEAATFLFCSVSTCLG
jgi:hypothetical protein